ncbi:OmpA family protein [Ochrobactrum sp. GPK 3]|uniref:OmpA family protein n=1 Tax=Brucella sp. 22210 TaxID=3453892 RepID=UPI0031385A96
MKSVLLLIWSGLAAIVGGVMVVHKAPQIQNDILERTSETMNSVNPLVQTFVDGRDVLLRGPERNEESKARTLATAREVWGALGPADGLWVSNSATAQSVVSIEKTADGQIQMSGALSADDHSNLAAAVAANFMGPVKDNITSTNGKAQLSEIDRVVKAFALLDAGSLIWQPDHYTLAGKTGKQSVVETVASLSTEGGPEWQTFIQHLEPTAQQPVELTPVAHFLVTRGLDNSLIASGNVGSKAQKVAILERLETVANGKIVDNIKIRDQGLPENWSARLMTGTQALMGFRAGTLLLDGSTTFLNGTVNPEQIEDFKSALPSDWQVNILPAAHSSDLFPVSGAGAAPKPDGVTNENVPSFFNQSSQNASGAPGDVTCSRALSLTFAHTVIHFDTSSVEIDKSNMGKLNSLFEMIRPCITSGHLKIIGHTDTIGAEKLNDRLSLARARSVKAVFLRGGFNPEDISVEGKGGRQPEIPNTSEANRSQNRRVTFDWQSK